MLALATTLLAVGVAAQGPPRDGAPRISQQEFKSLFATGNVVVVDTRNLDVYRLGHIPGAILLPLEGLQDFPPEYSQTIQQLKAEKKPIVTYCA